MISSIQPPEMAAGLVGRGPSRELAGDRGPCGRGVGGAREVPGCGRDGGRERASFTVERVLEVEAVTRHDIAAFVQVLADSVGPEGRWVHFGMTSSDVLDTGLALQLRGAADLLLERLEVLLGVVKRRALRHRDTVISGGRTVSTRSRPASVTSSRSWAFELIGTANVCVAPGRR